MADKRFQRTGLILNIIFVFGYLLVCLTPFLRSGQFWFVAAAGLIFPFLFLALFIFLMIALFRRSKRGILLNVITLLLGIQQILAVFAFHVPQKPQDVRPEGSLRVLSWNVNRWVEGNQQMQGQKGFRKMMMDMVQLQDADVLCFQEFFESYDPLMAESSTDLLKKMGYPYTYFFPSSKIYENKYQFGVSIFSRYPLTDSGQFITTDHPHSEGYCYVDLKWEGRPVRIFTTHLESFGVRSVEQEAGSGLGARLKYSYELRNYQATLLADAIRQSPYPVIVTGDLDDAPNSYAYFTVKGGLQDAFLKQGAGLGGTVRFVSFLPPLRIDYAFADRLFTVTQFQQLNTAFSDHDMLITDLRLK